MEGKHVDRRKARAEAISETELKAFANMANEFSEILYKARDLALGFPDEDEADLTLEQCTQRVKALPREFQRQAT